ncbi:MAG: hypothetical protein HKN70_06200, partial [Gammaproteobacteria bacterium]|nr:hypothetical protein [Gammaproteobacteria bacterium]
MMISSHASFNRHLRVVAAACAVIMASFLVGRHAAALQVCTTQAFGNNDFLG